MYRPSTPPPQGASQKEWQKYKQKERKRISRRKIQTHEESGPAYVFLYISFFNQRCVTTNNSYSVTENILATERYQCKLRYSVTRYICIKVTQNIIFKYSFRHFERERLRKKKNKTVQEKERLKELANIRLLLA